MKVGFIVSFEFLLWFTWVNTLEDAQATEVLQGNLHVADCVRASFVLTGFAFDASFNFTTHFIFDY